MSRDDRPADAAAPDFGKISQNWDQLEKKAIQLAERITDFSKKTGRKFDKMVVIPKGGYFLGLLLPEMLGFNNDQIIHTCLQTYVQGEGVQTGKLIVGDMPSQLDIKGQDLLIVDEVWDTGMTLDYLVRYLKDHGSKTITIAVLHYKPGKSRIRGKEPDLYVHKTNAWIDYAWEKARRVGKQRFSVAKPNKKTRIIQLPKPE